MDVDVDGGGHDDKQRLSCHDSDQMGMAQTDSYSHTGVWVQWYFGSPNPEQK